MHGCTLKEIELTQHFEVFEIGKTICKRNIQKRAENIFHCFFLQYNCNSFGLQLCVIHVCCVYGPFPIYPIFSIGIFLRNKTFIIKSMQQSMDTIHFNTKYDNSFRMMLWM